MEVKMEVVEVLFQQEGWCKVSLMRYGGWRVLANPICRILG